MERTSEIVGKVRSMDFDLDKYRQQIKKLTGVRDDLLRRHLGDVHEVYLTRQKCFGCQERGGFPNCWRDGDGKGNVRVVREVGENHITFANRVCEPKLQYDAALNQQIVLDRSGLTIADRGFTFDNFPTEQADRHRSLVDRARKFAEEFTPSAQQRGIFLFGPPGIAKTHLALAVTNQLADRGIEVVFTRADKLVNKFRDAVTVQGEIDRLLEWYSTVPVLVIDEFAQEQIKDYGLGKMWEVLSARAHEGLCTWFTSNYLPIQVYESAYHLYGTKIDALRSRVLMLATVAEMRGEDHRAMSLDDAIQPEW